MLPVKFGSFKPSGLRGECENVKVYGRWKPSHDKSSHGLWPDELKKNSAYHKRKSLKSKTILFPTKLNKRHHQNTKYYTKKVFRSNTNIGCSKRVNNSPALLMTIRNPNSGLQWTHFIH